MKTKALKTQIYWVIFISLILQGCLKDEFEKIENISNEEESFKGFDFSNSTTLAINFKTLNASNTPISSANLELFHSNPFDDQGLLLSNYEKLRFFKGATNKDGILTSTVNYLPYYDSIYIVSNYIGLPSISKFAVTSDIINVSIGGKNETALATSKLKSGNLKAAIPSSVTSVNGYYTIGTWNSNGVPDYLEAQDDVITSEFLDDINASLPERISLPESHPQYLNNLNDANLNVSEDCEVWVTFVHEGAGWRNTLGYYTYPIGNPPATANDIRDLTIIYPNVSYQGSGGGLNSGNKVQLFYLDPSTNEYSDTFPANTSIGWFLIAQGWNGNVTNGVYTHYSDVGFNNESDSELKKHNVLLYDEERQLVLMGFEDIRRDSGSDEDFNDAVFYTTITPFTAVETSFYQPIDTPTDTDGDGVTDNFDEYPDDPNRAFKNHYPAEGEYGTLVFEDLWPFKGDYDFNDLVIDYNFNQLTNSNNQVTGIESRIVVKAIGASYHNGFGIEINTPSSNVTEVTGQRITQDYITLEPSGAESNQSLATIICFDNAYNNLQYPGTGIGVNTSMDAPYVTPDTQIVSINFATPLEFSEIGAPPYNPFIIINKNRGVEVHLPNSKPTDLADTSLLGTGDDDSDISRGDYYVSDLYLPWAINIPISFDYPYEKEDITETHLQFSPWARSRGYNYMDWYRSMPNYRNQSKIYSKN